MDLSNTPSQALRRFLTVTLQGLAEKVRLVTEGFDSISGIECQPIQGTISPSRKKLLKRRRKGIWSQLGSLLFLLLVLGELRGLIIF
ncbi:unnamed protein product, partial [Allacma fusca]